MKKIVKQLISLSLLMALFASCEKDENKVYFEGGTNPALKSSVAGVTLPLSFANKDKEALRLDWTNPEYRLNTGISSQDVNYQIEIDTTGSNFTSTKKQTVAISKELNKTFLVSEFNDFLLNQLQLVPSVSHDIEIRVKSFLTNESAVLFSNTIKYKVTPYSIPPKIVPPASGTLFITGNALASDWTNTPPATQKFTKVSTTLYTLNVALIGGKSYTFLSNYGDWGFKYSIGIKNDPDKVFGGDFQWQGEDILAPPASGNYKIEVDFQRGKFAVTKL